MEDSVRIPLGVSHAANVPPQISTPHICKTRKAEVRKALTETTDHHHLKILRKSSAGDPFSDPAVREDVDEVKELKKNLERARAKLERRDEHIRSLESQAKGLNTIKSLDIEKKLEDLALRHAESKSKHQVEVDALRAENKKLQQSLSSHVKDAADLRRKYDLTGGENINLKREIESLRHAQTHSNDVACASRKEIKGLQDGQTKWKAERHHLEREVARLQLEVQHTQKQLHQSKEANDHAEQAEIRRLREENSEARQQVAQLEERLDSFREIEEENERMENLLSACSVAYRLLYEQSISKNEYQNIEERYLLVKSERDKWRSEAHVKRLELSTKVEEMTVLRDQLRDVRAEKEVLEDIVDDLVQDRAALRVDISPESMSSNWNSLEMIEIPCGSSEHSQLVDLALSHTELHVSHSNAQLDDLWEGYAPIRPAYDETQSKLVSCHQALTALERSMANLQDRHSSLEKQHASCASTITALINESRNANAVAEMFKVDMNELREEMNQLEAKARDDREALKRSNDIIGRSKTAEEVLDEEVQHLREVYISAAQYEELYNDLKEEHELIMAREEVAIREAERLGMENAELAGHTNEGQKINYVEGLRREMFGVKQELATTRHMLNRANDQIFNLQQEITTYRSIDPTSQPTHSRPIPTQPGFGSGSTLSMNGSTRTKVSRKSMVVHRQPEGGRLSLSGMRRSTTGRCTSGPVAGGSRRA
ncbi:hypothetical protein IAU59_001981 [Kwoniella sp. CBS 9459]